MLPNSVIIVAGRIPGPYRQIVHNEVLLGDVCVELEQGVVESPWVAGVGLFVLIAS